MRLIISLVILLLSLLSSVFSYGAAAALDSLGFRVDLTHVDAARAYTRSERLRRAATRSKIRAAKLSGGSFGPISVHPSQGEYVLDLAVGTPPLYFTGILDTGSDLIWTQCKTCMKCIPQPTPLFDPFASPSFSTLPCAHTLCRALASDHDSACGPNCIYHYHYGDDTDSIGFMGTETFTFGFTNKVHFSGVGFGCGLYNAGDIQNSSGVIGFGRGPISLISQLGVGTFSYCFTNNFADDSVKSPLFFGSMARLSGPNVRTTPLIRLDPSLRPASSFYHLLLKGITIGSTLLPIPPEAYQMTKDGSGGIIIDSGTSFLMLDTPLYKPFISGFRSQMKRPPVAASSLDLCYNVSRGRPPRVPRLVFHFQGADWVMPQRNYMVEDGEGLTCLVVQESPGISILGNVQTQNMHVLYDLKNDKLSFTPARCSQL